MLALLNVRFGDLRCGAAVGLPQLQKDAASAIAACAQVRFVRIEDLGIERSERPRPDLPSSKHTL